MDRDRIPAIEVPGRGDLVRVQQAGGLGPVAHWPTTGLRSIMVGPLGNERTLTNPTHNQAALLKFAHRAPDRLVSDAPVLGQLPLITELLAWDQLAGLDPGRDPISRLLIQRHD